MPMPVTVHSDDEAEGARFALDVEESAVPLVPEALTNVLKHANEHYAFDLFRRGTDGLAHLLKERIGEVDELLRALGRWPPGARSSARASSRC
ncbi:hypothetical protein ACH427_09235 [Streptomyces sp. NPDC020379]|uniref:hypothetical protein n=1 Tax=Streptomyces sp. NPDC020379 TaxID=3365071 RepID=UPI0037BCCF19